ncbi:UDP-3-O-acyl-N-acetylglucosamine deacetylase [Magnetovibrio sp. PR-2]|uniref:UDP-3-O-acyl-N-acetylglucosamine deacetylase n=1 Tax=Magnetovibrio sp. PR-2 TaxID=3120356 RepID=UPI002FCDEA7B
MIKQKTLKSAISCTGIGLHSGEKITMTLNPAEIDTGIVFRRTDIQGDGAQIPAKFDTVIDTRMCTTIGLEPAKSIATIEHLMAALAGSGVDNALIEVGGAEVPVMDGSSAPFLFLIDCAGVEDQNAARKAVRVLKPVSIVDGDKSAHLSPAAGFSLDFHIEFDNAAIGTQSMSVDMTDAVFKNEIARARTFGFLHEAEALWAAGLAKGASLDNAVVVSGDKIMNEDGLRFDDECVRHKILDAIGDLYLAGTTLQAHYTGTKASHALNNQLLRELFSDPANYEIVDQEEFSAGQPMQGASSWAKQTVAASPATA